MRRSAQKDQRRARPAHWFFPCAPVAVSSRMFESTSGHPVLPSCARDRLGISQARRNYKWSLRSCEAETAAQPCLPRRKARGLFGLGAPPPAAAGDAAPVEHLPPVAEKQEPHPVAHEELKGDPAEKRDGLSPSPRGGPLRPPAQRSNGQTRQSRTSLCGPCG